MASAGRHYSSESFALIDSAEDAAAHVRRSEDNPALLVLDPDRNGSILATMQRHGLPDPRILRLLAEVVVDCAGN